MAGCAAAPPAEIAAVDVTPSAKPPAAAVPDDAVVFAYSPEQPGDVCDEHRTTHRELVLNTGAEVKRSSTTLESHVRYEVLETNNGVSVKERVFYEKYDESSPKGARGRAGTAQSTAKADLARRHGQSIRAAWNHSTRGIRLHLPARDGGRERHQRSGTDALLPHAYARIHEVSAAPR